MNKEEIKEYLKKVDELEAKLTGEDKETLQWLLFGYNQCAKLLEENEQENKQLKDNWNELKKWLRIKDILANSKINPQSIKFKDLLKHMEYLEKYSNEDKKEIRNLKQLQKN